MIKDELKNYRDISELKKTPEPGGGKHRPPGKEPIFVIQKHFATNLHYDFRLEVEDVLASWAVPKGPPEYPGTKRLAVRTEDHPLEYADFEGVIPEGQYGAGAVIIWDRGTYINLRREKEENTDMEKSLSEGKIEVWLKGGKIKGGYYLIKTGKQKDKEQWLLIKARDEK
ncbi:MAG: DNA polymerase ligase N-terminal domain-containing protein [Actinomycetota bacterium]|nr:DNA polymerase ligase N-terminal domain-containing protein [Actinomycetota bacterium]